MNKPLIFALLFSLTACGGAVDLPQPDDEHHAPEASTADAVPDVPPEAVVPDAAPALCCDTGDAGIVACDPNNSFQCKRSRSYEPQCSNGECEAGDSCQSATGSGTVIICR